jgi:hypothetical protein
MTTPTPTPTPAAPAGDDKWAAFDTVAHRAAQAACRHVIHCAVDGDTRRGVVGAIDYARAVGDIGTLPLLLAQLSGPCCLGPAEKGQ